MFLSTQTLCSDSLYSFQTCGTCSLTVTHRVFTMMKHEGFRQITQLHRKMRSELKLMEPHGDI